MIGKSSVAFAAFLFVALCSLPTGQQQIVEQPLAADKLDVSIYYESLCPDSRNFMISQFPGAWATFSQYMNVKFIPFGKAKSHKMPDGTIRFACQHGPRECSGNRMQSCALSLLPDPAKQAQFVTCVMSRRDPLVYGPKCAEAVDLNFTDVENCYGSTMGDELQLQAEAATNSIRNPLSFVPTIVFNNAFSQELQDQSLYDFRGVVCSHLPGICSIQTE
ncbi:GILT-like protein 1 [Ischnura elegans]|uniref:GILT-like protein 1 n=1 Tax=Ischnura elegans TaxID=197161 RepID=UPI001ED8A61C|nr:GILT-like protein 1 [Ischnura elegans]